MRAGYALVTLAPLLWAGNFVIGRAVAGEISPLGLNTIRWSIAALCIAPVIVARAPDAAAILRTAWKELTVLAILGIVLFNTVLYFALARAGAAAVVSLFAFNPILVVLIAARLGGERFARAQWIGLLLSVGGVLLVVGGAIGASSSFAGLALAGAATVLWALYTCLLGHLRISGDAVLCLGLSVWIGVLIMVPIAFASGALALERALTVEALGAMVYLGLGASLLAFTAWQRGVRAIGPARAGVFMNLVPIFTLLLALGVLGEPVSAVGKIGLLLVIAGVILTQREGVGVGRKSLRADRVRRPGRAPGPVRALQCAPDPFVDQAVRALHNPQTHSPSRLPVGGLPDRRSA